jgi:hypothetical protein
MPRLDKIFLPHLAPRSSRQAKSRAGVLALLRALPARARCRRPVLLPASFIGCFAPRRLSLPSTPDGSPSPCSRASLCCPAG